MGNIVCMQLTCPCVVLYEVSLGGSEGGCDDILRKYIPEMYTQHYMSHVIKGTCKDNFTRLDLLGSRIYSTLVLKLSKFPSKVQQQKSSMK